MEIRIPLYKFFFDADKKQDKISLAETDEEKNKCIEEHIEKLGTITNYV